jgi:hypothetical protein
MELHLILNDLSVARPARDIFHARECMEALVAVIIRATTSGAARILRVPAGFQAQVLCEGYVLAAWQNDPGVGREQKQFFNTVVSKVSYLDGLPTIEDQLALVEYRHQGIPAKGLGVASAIDGLAVSVNFTDRWSDPLVALDRAWIELDGDGKMHASAETVCHASSIQHVATHTGWIRDRVQSGARDGAEIWRRRHELLPALEFCHRVETELSKLGPTDVMLKPVYDRLRELDNYARNWIGGSFDQTVLPSRVSPESESTIKEHGNEITFLCPDGENRLFTWHARLTPGAWRLHFYPNSINHRILIGRIGRKPFL